MEIHCAQAVLLPCPIPSDHAQSMRESASLFKRFLSSARLWNAQKRIVHKLNEVLYVSYNPGIVTTIKVILSLIYH